MLLVLGIPMLLVGERVALVQAVCLSVHRPLLRMPLGVPLLRLWTRRAADRGVAGTGLLKGPWL